MNTDSMSDEKLVTLHQRKKLNALPTIYKRYKNYGEAIVLTTLKRSKYYYSLKEEKDSIAYEALLEAIEKFDLTRGTFRNLFSTITEYQTYAYIREFKKNPLSEYVSLDVELQDGEDYSLLDTLTFADSDALPNKRIDFLEEDQKIDNLFIGVKRKTQNIIKMKQRGYSCEEIAKRYKTTPSAVRSTIYHFKCKLILDLEK